MLDFIIEVVGEVVGGILEFIIDGVSVKAASGRRARRERHQKRSGEVKGGGIENSEAKQ